MEALIESSQDKLLLSDYSNILATDILNPLKKTTSLALKDVLTPSAGVLSANSVNTNSYPLHVAAKNGDTITILSLFCEGYDVNQANSRNVKPIDIAAMYGQTNAVKILLDIGAKIDDNAYQDHTPLQFALMNGYYDTAALILNTGKADPNHFNLNGDNAFDITVNELENLINSYNRNPTDNAAQTIVNTINMIELLASYASEPAMYNEVITVQSQEALLETPVAVILEVLSASVSSEALRESITTAASNIDALFPCVQVYLNAKDLLVAFPTGQDYQVSLGGVNTWLESDGHYGLYTTQLATYSLGSFTEHLQQSNADPQMISIFSQLYATYQFSEDLIAKSGQMNEATTALNYYQQGNTLLIPSGWEGHFIDVILSQQQGWYVTANSGDRYEGESPNFVPDPAGIIIYQMTNPGEIDAQFVYDVVNNVDKMNLEIVEPYNYDIFGLLDNIVRPDQQYGNCAWESHRDAVEGLAYLELINQGTDTATAKTLANNYYQAWNDFHGNLVIDQYLSDTPILPVQAMLDILDTISQTPNFSSSDQSHGQLIANALVSPAYLASFTQWLQAEDQSQDPKVQSLINTLQQQYGIDVASLEASTSSLTNNTNSAATGTLSVQGPEISVVSHFEHLVPVMMEQPQFIPL